MDRNESQNYREFLRAKEALRKDTTRLHQMGRSSARLETEVSETEKTWKTKADHPMHPKDEKTMGRIECEEDSPDCRELWPKNQKLETRRKTKAQAWLEHDMREQALGQIYGVPGADIDYDEIRKMSQNGIRDASELASESLLNDGYEADLAKEAVSGILRDFVAEGRGAEDVRKLREEYSALEIAEAYANLAKNSSARDMERLEQIGELCGFEHPAFERAFDVVRGRDGDADRAMEWLELAMGLERKR